MSESQVLAVTENLNHPPLSWIPYYSGMGQPLWQCSPLHESFSPQWTATVSLNWLREFALEFLEPWTKNRGNQGNRDINKTMALTLKQNALLVGYDLGPQSYTQTTSKALAVHGASKSPITLRMLSVDWVFVMRQIADLNITGDIKLSASDKAMVLDFETDANSLQCWIPACDAKGKRNSAHCIAYTPEQSAGFDSEDWDLDDAIPEPTAEEDMILRERMARFKQ